MKDKLVRLCSIALALLLSAGWFAFAQQTEFVVNGPVASELVVSDLIEPERKPSTSSISYHFASMPDLPTPARAAACLPCHGENPHKKSPPSRAFLNFHTPRLDCMVCHLKENKKSATRMAWFESTPAGLKESSGDSMTAFLAPYTEGSTGREIISGHSSGPAAEVSEQGKHVMTFDAPGCESCHSAKGLARLQGYEGEALARLGKLDNITRFSEGKLFYYPRF